MFFREKKKKRQNNWTGGQRGVGKPSLVVENRRRKNKLILNEAKKIIKQTMGRLRLFSTMVYTNSIISIRRFTC